MMNTCDIAAVSALIDGELTDTEAALLREHLEGCPSCKALYADLTNLSGGFSALEKPAPDTLRPGIMYKIGLGDEPPRNRRIIRQLIAIAACVVVVLLVVKPTSDEQLPVNSEQRTTNNEAFDGAFSESGERSVERVPMYPYSGDDYSVPEIVPAPSAQATSAPVPSAPPVAVVTSAPVPVPTPAPPPALPPGFSGDATQGGGGLTNEDLSPMDTSPEPEDEDEDGDDDGDGEENLDEGE